MTGRTSTARVALCLWSWALLLRPLKHVMSFDRLVRLAHSRARLPRSPDLERRLETYMAARGVFPRRPPGNCLERSLGAYRMLCSHGADPTLMVGFRRDEAGQILGHVWVTLDGRALAEAPDIVSAYAPILSVDARGRQHPAAGASTSVSGMRFA